MVGVNDEIARQVRPRRFDDEADALGRLGPAFDVADDPVQRVAGSHGPGTSARFARLERDIGDLAGRVIAPMQRSLGKRIHLDGIEASRLRRLSTALARPPDRGKPRDEDTEGGNQPANKSLINRRLSLHSRPCTAMACPAHGRLARRAINRALLLDGEHKRLSKRCRKVRGPPELKPTFATPACLILLRLLPPSCALKSHSYHAIKPLWELLLGSAHSSPSPASLRRTCGPDSSEERQCRSALSSGLPPSPGRVRPRVL